ncbi:ATP-binding protein [Streptomyces sp. FBKL.4005]|uniref:ATP-binding protein n=1 Tax=Streptomyces sp. FBKL.4005 TaxID=2015515 RepID=UPI0026C0F90D
MSHLRAPATRADRREGGRHGRPVARPAPALTETHIRPQLMRLAVLPPLAVALSATAAVLFSIRSTGARTGPVLWAVLAGAVTVTVAGILIAAVAADRAARSVTDRVDALRRTAARGEAELHALVDALRQGEAPPQRGPRHRPPADADDFELLAADLARAHDGAVTAVVRAAQLSSQTGSEQKLEVFVNLARRLQSLVHREISILDDLENEIEDPDLLKGLFHVDHLATRIRRHAENLAVLGGAVSRRQWSNPVSMTEVLRSAIAEVEQYSRVKLVPPIDGELRGHAVADVIHLLAELIENATVFSAPHTQVLLRANLVTSGLAVEVEDRGLGMPVAEQNRMNALLADPDQVNVASLLADGRIGLYVVSQLARRHSIHVRLQTNIYGGVQAVLVVPQVLLGNAPRVPGTADATAVPPPAQTAVTGGARTAVSGGAPGAGSTPDAGNASGTGGASRPGGAAAGAVETAAGAQARDGAGEAGAGAGRRRHAQRGSGRRGSESGARGRQGAASPPLPVRGAQQERPTPAEAVPGISAEDRAAVEAHTGILPTPRVGTVRGTMDKPQLPRRRAQEHIVPQLRGGPAPRQDNDTVAGHDPGLMAAFQRGIGLAEAQQSLDAEYEEPSYQEPGRQEPEYGTSSVYGGTGYGDMGPAPMDAAHMSGAHLPAPAPDSSEPARVRPEHGGGSDHVGTPHSGGHHRGSDHMASTYMAPDPTGPGHSATGYTAPGQPDPHHTDPHRTDLHRPDADHMVPAHMVPDHMSRPDIPRPDMPRPDMVPDDMGRNDMGRDDMGRDDMGRDGMGGNDRTRDDRAPAPIPPAHTPAHTPAPASDGSRGTGRTEGSAPAE